MNVFFRKLLSCLIPKKIIKKNIRQSNSKIDFEVRLSKRFYNEINCKKCLISNTVYGRRHSKLFTNCYVSWKHPYFLLPVCNIALQPKVVYTLSNRFPKWLFLIIIKNIYLQCEPENSGIVRRLLESSYNFKKSNTHKLQQLCSLNRPIKLNQ